ncbi:lasso peptide biosynthesis B2 protein [Actinokineospora baliensis]|uniref:lasso peptide biosynthesis B2 protein n=1 Tax=Actinokineospora baliensis TaxID=547056 RepID=UPI003555F595
MAHPPLGRRVGTWSTAGALLVALLVRAVVKAIPLNRVHAITTWLVNQSDRPATDRQVIRVLDALDAAGRWMPVRLACLERSLSGVLILALCGRTVVWRTGVRTPPIAVHAWLVDTSGNPLGEPDSTFTYQTLMTISHRSVT